MKILIVEDDTPTIAPLVEELKAYHYIVDLAVDGPTGLELALDWNYDLVVLDWMLPGMDGPEICRQLRAKGFQKPILLLTVRNLNEDIITGLDAGADDFVSKPYNPSQLLARIRALLRRGVTPTNPIKLTWEQLEVNQTSADVSYGGRRVAIKPKAYNLLVLFLQNPQRIFSRQAILDRLWSFDNEPSENAVTNLIKDLRRTLKEAGMPVDPIETIYGIGYRLNLPPAGEVAIVPESPPPESGKQTRVHRTIARYRDSFLEQVAELERLLGVGANGSTPASIAPQDRQKAEEIAHKLAGGLGTFGYERGSELARELETRLRHSAPPGEADLFELNQQVARLREELGQTPQPAKFSASCHHILLIDRDRALAEELKRQAIAWNLKIEGVSSLTETREVLARSLPDAILLDPNLSDGGEDGFNLLRELSERFPEIPILIFTREDNLSERIMSARLGARRFLHKPIAPQCVFETIGQVLPETQNPDSRILIVDDDRASLGILRQILDPWGFELVSLQEPDRFWQVLTQTLPDLLILDLQMPTYTGIELCRVVRQDPTWEELPILVVTAHQDPTLIEKVFDAGADDFITKPIVGPELVARAIARIERSHLRRQLKQMRQAYSE
jgi:DNA-binding response OmpR family regulator